MRIALSILLLLLFVPTWSGEPPVQYYRPDARLSVRELDVPKGIRSGRLTYLDGWELDSRDPAFGGFSAIALHRGRFLLVSDAGTTLGFRLDQQGAAHDVAFGRFADGPGPGWRKGFRDSESIAVDSATGRLWVGFEPSERSDGSIWRYAPGPGAAEGHVEPAAMRDWPANGGAESMVRMRDGRFVVLSERAWAKGRRAFQAVAYAGDPVQTSQRHFRFGYRMAGRGMRPTDAAELPDGDLIVVNRAASFQRGFENMLTIVRRDAIRPGAIVVPRPVGRIRPPLPQDNYEGVAVTQEGSDTILYVVSDDNESILQRTVLLKFRLEPPRRRRTR